MTNNLAGARIAIALTGSFCTLAKVFSALPALKDAGARLTPIFSPAVDQLDTRFFSAAEVRARMTELCGCAPLTTIPEVEPIGPKKWFDLVIVAPCTGNTCAKLAAGIADTSVTMACKSQLRNDRPVLIGLSSNDGLSVAAHNIGVLLSRKNIFFVPFGQDDPVAKPTSLVLNAGLIAESARFALEKCQIQPMLVGF
ncbi:MAG: dipicolinate synthase subunit B [Clostridia bacterium]